jgi:cysteine desulfurase
MDRLVYLDNHAATRIDPRVLDAMMSFLQEQYGNAASRSHEPGRMAAAAVDVARDRVANLIGAEPDEIIFTSGATESVNLALKGAAEAMYGRRERPGRHIITVATEHRAVLDTCTHLERAGFRVTVLPVDVHGHVLVEDVAGSIADDTFLVSVMWANNEIGTIAPMAELAQLCASRGILIHSDATQAVGKIPVDLRKILDLLSFSAHRCMDRRAEHSVRRKSPSSHLWRRSMGGTNEVALRYVERRRHRRVRQSRRDQQSGNGTGSAHNQSAPGSSGRRHPEKRTVGACQWPSGGSSST